MQRLRHRQAAEAQHPASAAALVPPLNVGEDGEEGGQAARAEMAAEEEEELERQREWRHRVMSAQDVDELEVSGQTSV